MDKNVERVIQKYTDRADTGFKKYGVTTERDDLNLLDWLNHLQDELMDATIYIERLKQEHNNGSFDRFSWITRDR